MKIRCLLVDDNPENLGYLRALLSNEPDFEIKGEYLNAFDLLNEKAKNELGFDACFLDIQMPGMDGIELAAALKGKRVVFVSAHKDRAFEAFGVEAIDFVSKPIRVLAFQEALHKIRKSLKDEPGIEYAILQTDQGKTNIRFADIRMIESEKPEPRDKRLIMADGKAIILKNITFDALMDEYLSHKVFVQINNHQIIHHSIFKTLVSKDEIKVDLPGKSISDLTLSRSFASNFKKRFQI